MLAEIIVVTYHSHLHAAEELLRFIELSGVRSDVIFTLVDNSEDSSDAAFITERAAEKSTGLRVITRPDNPGFAGGCNLAALTSQAEWIVLINPDITFTEAHLHRLCETIQHTGPEISSLALSQITGSFRHEGISLNRAGWYMDRPSSAHAHGARDRLFRVVGGAGYLFGPSGGAAAYRSAVFRSMGGFHEPLMMWGEDADLAVRLHLTGHRCSPLDLSLSHRGGHSVASNSVSRRRARLLVRNRVITAARLYTGPKAALFGLFLTGVLLGKVPSMLRAGVLHANLAGVWDGIAAARSARLGYDGPRLGLLNHPNREV